MKELIRMINRIGERLKEDNITVYGAQASFFLIVSLIPFAIAFAALLQFILPGDQAETLSTVVEFVPDALTSVVTSGVNELFTTSATPIVSVSVVVALWSASKAVLGLERCFHAIYRIDMKDNFIVQRLKAFLYTVLFLIAVIIALGLLVFGNSIQTFAEARLPWLQNLTALVFALRSILSIGIFVIVFSGMYQVLSGARRPFTKVLPGVLFATCGWVIFSFAYSYYIENFSSYTYLYGSLGAIILFMLWIYSCIMILLYGAEFNVFLDFTDDSDKPDTLPAEKP